MSVVVIRGDVIAADTAVTVYSLTLKTTKLKREGDTTIGYVGRGDDGAIFADWYFAGADPEALPTFANSEGEEKVDFVAVALTSDGMEYWDSRFYRDTDMRCNEYIAIGSGAQVALGALYMGATAVEAVEAACAFEQRCALPVEHEHIEQVGSIRSVQGHGR